MSNYNVDSEFLSYHMMRAAFLFNHPTVSRNGPRVSDDKEAQRRKFIYARAVRDSGYVPNSSVSFGELMAFISDPHPSQSSQGYDYQKVIDLENDVVAILNRNRNSNDEQDYCDYCVEASYDFRHDYRFNESSDDSDDNTINNRDCSDDDDHEEEQEDIDQEAYEDCRYDDEW